MCGSGGEAGIGLAAPLLIGTVDAAAQASATEHATLDPRFDDAEHVGLGRLGPKCAANLDSRASTRNSLS
jgi:hypothetical protein